jgi:hypothetical protein
MIGLAWAAGDGYHEAMLRRTRVVRAGAAHHVTQRANHWPDVRLG